MRKNQKRKEVKDEKELEENKVRREQSQKRGESDGRGGWVKVMEEECWLRYEECQKRKELGFV